MALVDPRAREQLRHAVAQLDAAETSARPHEMSQALAAVARCYRTLRACASAEASFAQALRWAHASGATDQAVDLLCELAETALLAAAQASASAARDDFERAAVRAARERARDHGFEAARLARRVADPHWEVQVLLRVAHVLGRCGDADDAAALQTRALQLIAGPGFEGGGEAGPEKP